MRSKKAIYNVISNLLLQIIIIIYGFVVPKIIINKFGSDVNGLISSITQFLAYISLLESGFGPVVKSALYKPIAEKNKKEISNILVTSEKFFHSISFIFIIYIVVLFFVYPKFINNEFNSIYTISLIAIIGISTFAEYFFGMTYRLFLQTEQKNYITSVIQIIVYILNIIIVILLAKVGLSVHLIYLFSALVFVLRPICQNIYVKRKYDLNFKENDSNYILKQKWDGLAQHIASVIHNNTATVVLTICTSLKEVSVYSVYYLIVKGLKSLIQSFTNGIDATFGDMIAKGENKNLNIKFNLYEIIYLMIATIIFTCTILLITPFVNVYTKGITDANYIRYTFGYLLVISEYIWAIRLPYSSITLAAGHFKETRTGAWIEAILNIIISVILVWKFGLTGVAIGTIVAMTIRTVEFIYHTNKYILNRNIFESFKKVFLVIIETCLIVFICKYLPYVENVSYMKWIINAVMTGIVSVIVVLTINAVVYKNDMKSLIKLIKGLLHRSKKTVN